jgi:hypothetical protein
MRHAQSEEFRVLGENWGLHNAVELVHFATLWVRNEMPPKPDAGNGLPAVIS